MNRSHYRHFAGLLALLCGSACSSSSNGNLMPVPSAEPLVAASVSNFKPNGSGELYGLINGSSTLAKIETGSSAYASNDAIEETGRIPSGNYRLSAGATSQERELDLDLLRRSHRVQQGPEIDRPMPVRTFAVIGNEPRAARAVETPPPIGTKRNWYVGDYIKEGVPGTSVPMTVEATALDGKAVIWLDDVLIDRFGQSGAKALAKQYSTYVTASVRAQLNFANAPGPGLTALDWLATAKGMSKIAPACNAAGKRVGKAHEYIDSPGYTSIVVPKKLYGVYGYVYSVDLSPQEVDNCDGGFIPANYSNEAPAVYVAYLGQTPKNFYYWQTTLTHEMQHLTSEVNRLITLDVPPQARWIEEGMGQLAQDYTSANGKVDIEDTLRLARTFLAAPQNYSLTGFAGIENGELVNGQTTDYILSWLFLKYLSDRFGNDVIKAITTNPQPDTAGIAAATRTSFRRLFTDFVNTLAVSNTGIVAPGSSEYARYDYTSFSLHSKVKTQFFGTYTLDGPARIATLAPKQGVRVRNMFYSGFAFFGFTGFLKEGTGVQLQGSGPNAAALKLTGGIGQE